MVALHFRVNRARWIMGMFVGGKRATISEMNVVPLIDILLVLLVIFMIIPHTRGLKAEIPQASDPGQDKPRIVVVQVLADGSLRVNQEAVQWDNLESRLTEVFEVRADRTAFIRGDESVEFAVVARVIDVMHTAGIAPIGLLTQQMGNGL
jgi:biopolymer transport protein TolR